jgi:hypothetical protein
MKQNTLDKGGKKGTRWMDPIPSKKETTNWGGPQGEHEQIKYSNPPNHNEHIK